MAYKIFDCVFVYVVLFSHCDELNATIVRGMLPKIERFADKLEPV